MQIKCIYANSLADWMVPTNNNLTLVHPNHLQTLKNITMTVS